jgi:hypothetical protein
VLAPAGRELADYERFRAELAVARDGAGDGARDGIRDGAPRGLTVTATGPMEHWVGYNRPDGTLGRL